MARPSSDSTKQPDDAPANNSLQLTTRLRGGCILALQRNTMKADTILNYMPVSESVASSGQPEDGQSKLIADAGVEAIVNLAMPNSAKAIPEEGNIAQGISVVEITRLAPSSLLFFHRLLFSTALTP